MVALTWRQLWPGTSWGIRNAAFFGTWEEHREKAPTTRPPTTWQQHHPPTKLPQHPEPCVLPFSPLSRVFRMRRSPWPRSNRCLRHFHPIELDQSPQWGMAILWKQSIDIEDASAVCHGCQAVPSNSTNQYVANGVSQVKPMNVNNKLLLPSTSIM